MKEQVVNKSIKDFKIISLLAKGSYGWVFLVEEKKSLQLYAMKVLDKKLYFEWNIERYALTEWNILSVIKHPFIVRLKFAF